MSDILLFRARQPDAMRTLIDRAATSRVRALNIDTDVLLDDWLPRLEFVQYRDVLDRQAPDRIGLDSLALAQNWYQTDGSDPTMADGLSFGQYIDYEMKRVFTVVCRQIAFLDVLRPARILLADDGSLICRTTMAYAATHGALVDSVPANPVSQHTDWLLPEITSSIGPGRKMLKWLLCKISQLLLCPGRSESLTLLVQPYSYTRSLIEAILTQTRHRLVLPALMPSYLGRPRAILTDWRLAPVHADAVSSRARTWSALEAAMTQSEALSYRGVSLWPVVRHVVRTYWDNAWEKVFCRQVGYCSHLFDRLHLDAVVVLQDQTGMEKLLVMMARQRGVPSFYVAHGIPAFRCLGYPGVNADTLIVWGDKMRERWQQFVPVRRVVALGNDELGHLPRRVQACDRELLRAQIGQEKTTFIILFAASPYADYLPADEPADQNHALKAVCRVAARLPGASILIRLHPSTAAYESVEIKRAIVEYYNRGSILFDPGFTLEEALAASDVVVTVDSTVGIQAIAAHKPLVILDWLSVDAAGYVQGEAGAAARTEDELLATLKRLMIDPNFREEMRACGQRFLAQSVVGVGDGLTGARLLAEIERVCTKVDGSSE